MPTAVVVHKNEHLGWWVVCQPTTCFDLVSVNLCYNLLELYLFHHMAESCRKWWKALGASGFGHLAQDWLFAMLCFFVAEFNGKHQCIDGRDLSNGNAIGCQRHVVRIPLVGDGHCLAF